MKKHDIMRFVKILRLQICSLEIIPCALVIRKYKNVIDISVKV